MFFFLSFLIISFGIRSTWQTAYESYINPRSYSNRLARGEYAIRSPYITIQR